jgi:hypothetical protein
VPGRADVSASGMRIARADDLSTALAMTKQLRAA